MRQVDSVARLKQTSQCPTVALTSRIASASPSASSSEALRMWKASRCAVRCPMPGRRASSVMSRLTGAANRVLRRLVPGAGVKAAVKEAIRGVLAVSCVV